MSLEPWRLHDQVGIGIATVDVALEGRVLGHTGRIRVEEVHVKI